MSFDPMDKQLDELTNEEFGKLFPIIISEPDTSWVKLFMHEENKIREAYTEKKTDFIKRITQIARKELTK